MKKATRKSKFAGDVARIIEAVKSGNYWEKGTEQVLGDLQYSRTGAGYKQPAKKHLYIGRKIWLLLPHSGIKGIVCRAEIVNIKKRPGMNDLVSYVEKDSSGNGKVGSADSCYVWTTDDLLKTLSVMQTGLHKTKRKVRRIEHAGAAIDRSGLFE